MFAERENTAAAAPPPPHVTTLGHLYEKRFSMFG